MGSEVKRKSYMVDVLAFLPALYINLKHMGDAYKSLFNEKIYGGWCPIIGCGENYSSHWKDIKSLSKLEQ